MVKGARPLLESESQMTDSWYSVRVGGFEVWAANTSHPLMPAKAQRYVLLVAKNATSGRANRDAGGRKSKQNIQA
jgi:hypothetical protein